MQLSGVLSRRLTDHNDDPPIWFMHLDPNSRLLILHLLYEPVDRVHMVPELLLAPCFPIFTFSSHAKPSHHRTNLPQKLDDRYVNIWSRKLRLNPASHPQVIFEFEFQWLAVFVRKCGKAQG